MVGVKTLITESRACAEDKVKTEEHPENSNKDSEAEVNSVLDDSKEESSVGSVTPEKWQLKGMIVGNVLGMAAQWCWEWDYRPKSRMRWKYGWIFVAIFASLKVMWVVDWVSHILFGSLNSFIFV